MAVFPARANESDGQREWRLRVRDLFDGVASRYDGARSSYPAELVDWMVATARLSQGAQVLEIGCGTGQLTSQLAARGFNVTAIDMGTAMIELARARARGHISIRSDIVRGFLGARRFFRSRHVRVGLSLA